MKPIILLLWIFAVFALASCVKSEVNRQVIVVPNGDFEVWDDQPKLLIWETNSCPLCVPAFDTYVIKKETEAVSGKFAAKFIFNGVYSSIATNKFAISSHPTTLKGYIKSNISNGDTAIIHIDIFSGNNIVDQGEYFEISPTSNYKPITIQLSQTAITADSALIEIRGGNKGNTFMYVDNLTLIKDN